MNLLGTVTGYSGGLFVNIPALKTEYGALSHLGEESDYSVGDRVVVSRVGPDEYVVLGVVHP